MKKTKDKKESLRDDSMEEIAIDLATSELAEGDDEPTTADVSETDLGGDGEDDGVEITDPVEAELAALREERDELKEQALRARAEFENYRKRMMRESERIRKTAAEGLMRALLPIVDNLERALSHVEDKSDGLAQGVEMIVKQFADVLSGQGLELIPAKGEPFDPNIHEALTHQPSDEFPADTVMEEFQRGYRVGDFILRPSQVVVSSGPAVQAESTSTDDAGDTGASAPESTA